MMDTTAKALIADDERLMREQLRGRLHKVWPALEIVAEAANGAEAVEACANLKPDIAFLDIRMPGMSGLEAAAQLDDGIHVVFVTAYDEYAVAAFERGALDYLLKPVAVNRLERTVARLQQQLANAGQPARDGALLAELVAHLKPAVQSAKPLEWIQASIGDRLEFIAVDEVLFFQSADKYTRVVRASGEALIRKPIYELLAELDPARFWQVHRSTIVSIKAIAEVTRDFRGHQMIRLRENDERLEVSRSFSHLFKQM